MSEPDQLSLKSARDFASKYAHATSEKQLGQSFWRDFFLSVVEVPDLLVSGIEFEYPIRSSKGTVQFIDCLWSGVALSPFIHMVPQEYQNLRVGQLASHLAGPALLQLEAAAVAISQDPEKAMEVVESGNQMAEEFVVAIGENLDIDLSGLNPEEASKSLQESLEGDTTRLRIGELRPGLVQEFGKDFESAWRFLLPVIRLGIRMQKFLKLANQKKNEIEAEQRIDLETHARTSEEWKRLRAAVANFQAWSDTTIESGHGNRIEGERLFLEVVQHYGGALSGFGIQGSEILAVTDAKPASWVNDEDDDEEC